MGKTLWRLRPHSGKIKLYWPHCLWNNWTQIHICISYQTPRKINKLAFLGVIRFCALASLVFARINGYINCTPSSTHYDDVIMSTIASQITSLTIVYSTIYSGADQSKHQSSASLAFVWGIHRGPVNSPHKLPVTRKMFPFDDVIMIWSNDESPGPYQCIHLGCYYS